MKHSRRHMLRTAGVVGLAAVLPRQLLADVYPSSPIHIIVPYPPGGIADIAARLVGNKLAETLGQAVVIDNKPGGSGFIGVVAAARAPANGYTLVVGTPGDFTINPAWFKKLPYDVEKDLTPIAMLSDTPLVLVAHGGSPYKSVQDVLKAAKAQPEGLQISASGVGTLGHLSVEQFARAACVKLSHIPFSGAAPAATAVAAGQVPLGLLAIPTITPFIETGQLRVLAVATEKRTKFNPDWPTLQEAGGPPLNASNWTGMFAPKGLPDAIIRTLSDQIQKILVMDEIRERFGKGGSVTTPMSISDFDSRVKMETENYRKIVKESGFGAE